MERPIHACLARLVLISLLILASGIPDANAAGVLVCDNCRDPRALAMTSGTGLTIVTDYAQRRLHGFDVEYDRELRRYRAVRTPVPESIVASFDRIMSMLDGNARLNARQYGKGVQFDVHPDAPTSQNGITFPDAHKNLNAYDVVQLATERTRLEGDIGKAFSGATTSSPAWNSMATFLTSIAFSFVSQTIGVENAVIVITWRDGSKTNLAITPDSVSNARYVSGESRDAAGNRIPDGAATDPRTAPGYAGVYSFASHDDLDRWSDTGRLYGVNMFSDGRGESLQVVCYWDGRDITCRLPR